jgi:hypothetical protein
MAQTTFKRLDKQRFKKIYPAKRFKPVMVVQTEKSLAIETATLTFTEASSATTATYTFTSTFDSIPNVTPGIKSTDGDMVLVKITALTTQSVTVEISAPFDGTIDLQIVEIGI